MPRKKPHVGTSGWTYDDWAGRFYPEDVKGARRLVYYAQHFDTVEVNATFYRLPTRTMINAWNRRLAPSFHMVLKGSRLVTHRKRLKDCKEAVETFFERAGDLKTLRAILWQLPPSQQKDLPRLDAFLSRLPKGYRYAVEFRHASWWDDDVAELLSKHKTAFVAISHPSLPDTVVPTEADFLYVRFHGLGDELYSHNYTKKQLSKWVRRLKKHEKGRELYAFFNNDYHAYAPKNAETFRRLLAEGQAL